MYTLKKISAFSLVGHTNLKVTGEKKFNIEKDLVIAHSSCLRRGLKFKKMRARTDTLVQMLHNMFN